MVTRLKGLGMFIVGLIAFIVIGILLLILCVVGRIVIRITDETEESIKTEDAVSWIDEGGLSLAADKLSEIRDVDPKAMHGLCNLIRYWFTASFMIINGIGLMIYKETVPELDKIEEDLCR